MAVRRGTPALLLWAALACGGPGDDFARRTARPADVGLDSAALAALSRDLAERNTEAFLVVHNGRIVHEWYGPGRGPESRIATASMQKGLAGGLGLALLLESDALSLDDRASRWIESWSSDPLRSAITVRHLATHSSGLEHAGDPDAPANRLTGWKRAFWERRPGAENPIALSIREAPVAGRPGERFLYSGPGFAALSYVLAAAGESAGYEDLRDLLRERVYRPIGIADREWRIGYGRPFEVEGRRVWGMWGGGQFTARALARLGLLLLDRGWWAGERVLSPRAIETVVRYGGTPVGSLDGPRAGPAPAAGWWTNELGAWPGLPRHAFAATAAHRILLVVPGLRLVVVRLGDRLDDPGEDACSGDALYRHLIEPLLDAFPDAPVPWSDRISGAWLDPVSRVECGAPGSDDWTITWAGDGALYAAYGDGWGFVPRTDRKLSLGFARIDGGPEGLAGRNIRSPPGEGTGDGPAGAKASGLLEVDGLLYMWARNMENSVLAWSADGARTWEWEFRFAESFGSPTFMQFGPGYQGARDEFVYVYSQDGPSAYESDDRLILARVHRDSVRDHAAYRFFAGAEPDETPRWSADLGERAGVFHYRGGVRRSEVVYSPWMRRYLLALGFDGSTPGLDPDGRTGGWGLFDAPEPWGPWTALFLTPRGDIPGMHSYRLPTKWMDDGGRTLRLVFSGKRYEGRDYDAFCTRRLRLLPVPRRPSGVRYPG